MPNRIDQCFAALQQRNEKAFIAYICAGDPNLSRTVDLDLALEEDQPNDGPFHIRLIAPTTPPERIEQICARAAGFIYYVSREGVTGVQSSVASSVSDQVAQIRRHTTLPIAVGFGISTA